MSLRTWRPPLIGRNGAVGANHPLATQAGLDILRAGGNAADAAVAILQRMVDCNVRIAVDNFGQSLAPLNHLVRLPIDMVKMDPKMTVAATSPGRQQAVVEALIHLGRTLGVQVVAQGIETTEQLDALCRMGCELGQGHLLSYELEPSLAYRVARLGSGNGSTNA